MDYNNGNNTYVTPEVKCPGKEITGMILGINALLFGIFAIAFGWIPFGIGVIYGIVFALFGIGTGIAAIVLWSKVCQQATVTTRKGLIGKNLGLAGIIVSGCGIVFSIICCAACASSFTNYYY